MTRIPKVGEEGWKNELHVPIQILAIYQGEGTGNAVMPTWVWCRVPGSMPVSLPPEHLFPPEPTVTHTRWVSGARRFADSIPIPPIQRPAEAKLERFSDGTWKVTNLKEGS